MRKWLEVLAVAAFVLIALCGSPAGAQDIVSAQTVSACGTPNNTPVVGSSYPVTQDTTGVLCTSVGSGGGNVTVAGPLGSKVSASSVSVVVASDQGAITVKGATADGVAATTNPVLIAGTSDGTGTGTTDVAQVSTAGALTVGGVTANTADAVATSSTNTSGLSYIYGWNGTTWDRLRDDPNRELFVDLATNGVSAFIGSPADAGGASTTSLYTVNLNEAFNGTSWDRVRTAGSASSTGTGVLSVEEDGRSFNNITTATTTTVKSGAGYLHQVCINKEVASGVIAMFNNTAGSGATIGTITNPSVLIQSSTCLTYDLYFSTGLTIVTTGAQDITVTYR